MKGFKKNNKFIPTGNKNNKPLSSDELIKVEHIDLNDPKQQEFVNVVRRRMKQDADKLKNVKSVVIQDKRIGESLAEKIPQKDGTEKLVVRYSPKHDPEEADGLIVHELSHVSWDDLEANHPEKIREFILDVVDEEPFTDDLRDIQKEIDEAMAKGKPTDELMRKYFDEYHSEIAQVNDRIKMGLVNREDVNNQVNLEKITMAYNKLHRGNN